LQPIKKKLSAKKRNSTLQTQHREGKERQCWTTNVKEDKLGREIGSGFDPKSVITDIIGHTFWMAEAIKR
jgi:hypothetical protein